MSQKPKSGSNDDDFHGSHSPHSPIPGAQGMAEGDPTVPMSFERDRVADDATVLASSEHSDDSTLITPIHPETARDRPDPNTPGNVDRITGEPPMYYPHNPYPFPSGASYDPYANAYAPPPPPSAQTANVVNPYDPYGPTIDDLYGSTINNQYPPLPNPYNASGPYGPAIRNHHPSYPVLPARPEVARQHNVLHKKGRGKVILVALLALFIVVGSALFAYHTYIASTYPFSNQLALQDPLTGPTNTVYDWNNNGKTCFFGNAAYHVTYTQQNHFHHCIATNTDFTNFTFEAEMEIEQGNANVSGGLIFRADMSSDKFYCFFIDSAGNYQLRAFVDRFGSRSAVLKYGTVEQFRTGLDQMNTIAVNANNDRISLYVNKQLVATTTDENFSHGQIGFDAVTMNSNNAEVLFTNAKVWTL